MTDKSTAPMASISDTLDAVDDLLNWHYCGYQGLPADYVKEITDRCTPGIVTAWQALHDALKYIEEVRALPVTEDVDAE